MIVACLIDAGVDAAVIEQELDRLGIGRIRIHTRDVKRGGIRARTFVFDSSTPGESLNYAQIIRLLEESNLTSEVKQRSLDIFDLLASVEANVHGTAKEEVHFHEVGAIDSIVDIVGASAGIESLCLDEIVCSPIALGTGSIQCQHGTLPVPSPATLELVKGLEVRGWKIDSELSTPTGVAILKVFASYFGEIPSMEVKAIGYGAGTKELAEIPNVMRFILGEKISYEKDRAVIIETNIDDMNPEMFSHLIEDLIGIGALDAWVTNIMMKKGRPAFNLAVLAEAGKVQEITRYIFAETTTSGVRMNEVGRYKLKRRIVEIETRFGRIRAKVLETPAGEKCMPEYDDCLKAARTEGLPVTEIIEEVKYVFRSKQNL